MIRWGVIGAGNIATRFLKAINNIEGQEVYCISSRNLQKATSVAEHFKVPYSFDDYQRIFEMDVNFIYVATPHDSHFQITKEAMAKGVPILIEKPVTMTLEECEELIEMAKSEGVKIMEALKTLFLPAYRKLKVLLEQEIIGDIVKIETSICNLDERFDSYLYTPSCGGSLYDIGVYNVACLVDILGDKYQLEAVEKVEKDGVNLYTVAKLDFGGVEAIVECAIDRKKANQMIITGTKGTFTVPLMHRPKDVILTNEFTTRFHQGYEYDDMYSQIVAFTQDYYENEIVTYDKMRTIAAILQEIKVAK